MFQGMLKTVAAIRKKNISQGGKNTFI